MDKSINNHLMPHILLRLSPDVFFHPLWTYYYPRSGAVSSEIIGKLHHPIQKLLGEEDYRSAAQLMLVCAALQKRHGDLQFAIDITQKVWNIGESQSMPEIAIWAAWGGCAICSEMGDYCLAADYLERIQEQIDGGEDWVLASTIEIIKNTLLEPVSEQDIFLEVLNWLRSWGEPTYEYSYYPDSKVHSRRAAPDRNTTQALDRFSKPWWRALIIMILEIISGKLPLWGDAEEETIFQIEPVQVVKAPTYNPYPPPQAVQQLPDKKLSDDIEVPENDPAPEPERKVSLPGRNESRQSLKFYCLGSFRLYQNEQWVYRWVSRKALSVLKYLIVYYPAPVSKDALMESLWPEADPESARRNLHQAIYTLRHTLKESSPDFQHVLFEKEHYHLNPNMEIWLDFVEFEQHYHEGQNLEALQKYYDAIRAYESAEQLYRGDFMGDDLYEDLPAARRQYYWEMYLSTVYRLTRCYLELDQTRAAIAANQRLLERDKTQETAHQNLIKCYILQGQRNLAIRQYHSCVQILKEELDIPPSAETRAIYQEIIQM